MARIKRVDHVEQGMSRLITQWKDKPVIVALLKSYLIQHNEIENACFQLLENRSIYNAAGVNLDIIGALFGVRREGMSDEEYRAIILLRISQLNVDGTTEVFMNVLRGIGDTYLVDFWEHLDADIHAYMGAGYNSKTFGQIASTSAAGVAVRIIVDDTEDSFIPVELLPTTADIQVDDGSLVSDLQVDYFADLQAQLYAIDGNVRGNLPEIIETSIINPLADLITQNSTTISDNLIYENGDLMVDEDGNPLLWVSYKFI